MGTWQGGGLRKASKLTPYGCAGGGCAGGGCACLSLHPSGQAVPAQLSACPLPTARLLMLLCACSHAFPPTWKALPPLNSQPQLPLGPKAHLTPPSCRPHPKPPSQGCSSRTDVINSHNTVIYLYTFVHNEILLSPN